MGDMFDSNLFGRPRRAPKARPFHGVRKGNLDAVRYTIGDMRYVRDALRKEIGGDVRVTVQLSGEADFFFVVIWYSVPGAPNGGARSHPCASTNRADWDENSAEIARGLLKIYDDPTLARSDRNKQIEKRGEV